VFIDVSVRSFNQANDAPDAPRDTLGGILRVRQQDDGEVGPSDATLSWNQGWRRGGSSPRIVHSPMPAAASWRVRTWFRV
jgi:hypothetical protein